MTPKLHSPAADRNAEPILQILRRILPAQGTVLMIASGSGQHDVHFARALPHLRFLPSDADPTAIASIEAYREEAGLPNLAAPIALDVLREPWPVDAADAIVNINMIHISPWAACLALFRGAERLRVPLVYLYGPYVVEGRPLEPSNAAFDRSLRARDPEWGLRAAGDVEGVARDHGLRLVERIDMPANNTSLVFRAG